MGICKIKDCDTKSKARQLCMKHYMRLRAHGDPMAIKAREGAHGKTSSPEYYAWMAMKARCYRESHKDYQRYGGRGIRVCDEWRESFAAFLRDMGERTTEKHSIDRIDTNGGYEKGNCRWATSQQQVLNRRSLAPGKSGYYGVSKVAGRPAWKASISCFGRHYIGSFTNPEDAAWMYDQWAVQLHGDLAKLNFDYTRNHHTGV